MKVKRQKHVRKILTFYKTNFGYDSPYKVLVDGTFCRAALNGKININEQLPKYMDAEVKLCTTSCVMAECRSLGSLLYGPLKILEQYAVVPCQHKKPILATNCLRKMALRVKKNKDKFFIATQDATLTAQIRQMAGVALVYIAFNAINLEPPSEKSRLKAENKRLAMLAPSAHEKLALDELRTSSISGELSSPAAKQKRKKIRGPNPLSCKKKSKRPLASAETGSDNKRQRKRKRHSRKNRTDCNVTFMSSVGHSRC